MSEPFFSIPQLITAFLLAIIVTILSIYVPPAESTESFYTNDLGEVIYHCVDFSGETDCQYIGQNNY